MMESQYILEWELFSGGKPPKYVIRDINDDRFAVDFRRTCANEMSYLYGRNASDLVHFTHIENLESILNLGIVPRNQLPAGAKVSDYQRLDGHLDCICTSISFPNYKMLYLKENGRPDDYVILGIDIRVLELFTEAQVAFFPDNAAGNEYRSEFERYTGMKSLKALFADSHEQSAKSRALHLPYNYTTNPQAEVLIRGVIPQKYIQTIYVCSEQSKNNVERILTTTGSSKCVVVDNSLFSAREDYRQWSKESLGGFTDNGMQTGF